MMGAIHNKYLAEAEYIRTYIDCNGDRPVDSKFLLSMTVPYIINKQIMNKRICFLN